MYNITVTFRFLLSVDESSDHLNALNKDGRSALMVAVDGNKIEVVKEILEHELVDKAIKDRWGMTAVDIGCVRKQAEMVELLGGEMKEREVPVKMKGRSKTVKHCNTKIPSLPGFSPPKLNTAPKILGARPKIRQLRPLTSSNSLDSLLTTVPTTESSLENQGDPTVNTYLEIRPELQSRNSGFDETDSGSHQTANELAVEQLDGHHGITFQENLVDVFEFDTTIWASEDIDTEVELSTDLINNDLVEEVRKNILSKIDEYNDKISEEESSFMAMKDLLLKKKKVQTMLMTEINKEKKEFYEKNRKEKEIFEKKQESEMNTFFEHIR